jgi:hypothetical protein
MRAYVVTSAAVPSNSTAFRASIKMPKSVIYREVQNPKVTKVQKILDEGAMSCSNLEG